MSYVVVDPKGNEVARFAESDWREACKTANAIDGRVHTEGKFDEGRSQ